MNAKYTLTLVAFTVASMLGTTPAFARVLAPTDLAAHAVSSSTINLGWNDGNINATGFNVERSRQPKRGFAPIAKVAAGSRSMQDRGLISSTTYYYRVQTMIGSKKSHRSAVIAVTTMPQAAATAVPTPVPTVTQVATTTPVPTVTAVIEPTAVATAVPTVTAVRTAVPTVTSTPIRTATVTATVTMAPTRTATTTPIRTATVTATRTPVPTETVTPSPSPTADTIAPSAPTNVRPVASGCTQVDLSWSASTDSGGSNLKGYNVYRNGNLLKQVAAPSTATSDAGLAGSTSYAYAVAAIDNAGNVSAMSSSASATTAACNRPPVANAGTDRTGDAGTSVSFDGSQSTDPDGTIATYAWTFGDGTSGSGATPTHTYTSAGSYTATLTVTDNAGATGTDTATVTVEAGVGSGEVVWRQARGGTGFDVGYGSAVDGDGNVVVTGTFTDTANFGSGALRSAGAGDIFLAKYTEAGAPVWSKRFGGADADIGYSVAVDQSANCDGNGGTDCIVVAGLFSSTVSFGGAPLTSAGVLDIFVAKYSAAGAHLWSKRFGDIYEDVAYGVAVDANGNTFLTGFFSNSTDFGGGTLYSQYYNRDVFVAKLSSNGSHVWSKNFWSTSSDVGQAIAVDAAGDVAVTGFFTGSLDFGTGRLSSRKDDIFVAKLSGADGRAVWARAFGGTDVDRAQGVTFDHSGNVIATGLIYNGTVDFGGGALTTGYNQDGFVVKLTGAAGAHVWSKLLGSTGSDAGLSVTADAGDNVTVFGYFQNTVDFGGSSLTSSGNGSADMFLASYSANGASRWVRGFGGTSNDGWQGGHVATDGVTNEIIVTSSFQATAAFGGGSLTSAGTDDVCVVKVQP